MTNIPTRSPSGGLDCPRCGTRLGHGKAPLNLHGEYVGKYEALVCPVCHYAAFTSNGIQMATEDAKQIGLVGPAEPGETVRAVEELLVVAMTSRSANVGSTTMGRTLKSLAEVRDETVSSPGELAPENAVLQRTIRYLSETYGVTTAETTAEK